MGARRRGSDDEAKKAVNRPPRAPRPGRALDPKLMVMSGKVMEADTPASRGVVRRTRSAQSQFNYAVVVQRLALVTNYPLSTEVIDRIGGLHKTDLIGRSTRI